MPLLDKDFLSRLATLEVVSRRLRRGRFRGERRSLRRGTSVEFADHRPYGAGDDLRFLDWNLYARLDQLMTKLFHDEEDLAVHLIVDRSRSMDFGKPTKLLLAKRIAAAIGYVALLGMNRVSLYAPGAEGDVELRFLRGPAKAQQLFDQLERLLPDPIDGLGEPLRRWVSTRRPRGVLIVVSDLLHRDGAWEHLRPLVRGGLEVHCVRILTPDELHPDLEGDLKLVDAEDGSAVDVSISPGLLDRYERARAAYDQKLESFCRSREIALASATTEMPFEGIVLDALRRQGLLR